MLLQCRLDVGGIHTTVVQVDEVAQARQNEAVVVGLQGHGIVHQIHKLEPVELPQAGNLCKGSNLVAPCTAFLQPASVSSLDASACRLSQRQLLSFNQLDPISGRELRSHDSDSEMDLSRVEGFRVRSRSSRAIRGR